MKLSMNDREMTENQARTWKKPALQLSTGSSTTLSNATDKAVAGFFFRKPTLFQAPQYF